ncbi:MAG: SCO family protein [Pseudomonadota bacterium]
MPKRRWIAGAGAVLLLATTGCRPAKPAFASIDITGAGYARNIDEVDASGTLRRLADYGGRVVLVFFGFAQCPDVCPTALARQAEVMQLLASDADRVQVIFISVDPERDSDEILRAYTAGFDPRFTGWRFDLATTARLAREFKVFYSKVPLKDSALEYTIDHTALTFVFDVRGQIRLAVRHEQTPESVASDLKQLLDER